MPKMAAAFGGGEGGCEISILRDCRGGSIANEVLVSYNVNKSREKFETGGLYKEQGSTCIFYSIFFTKSNSYV